MAQWEFLVPNLPVRDVRAAQAWYRDVLGLGVNWHPVQRPEFSYPGEAK